MSFIPNLYVLNKYGSVRFNPRITAFRGAGLYQGISAPYNDSFSTNPLYNDFGTKAEIESAAKSNPKIMSLLKQYNLPLKLNMEELEALKAGHLKDARITSAKIYSALPENMKGQVNLADLQQAAILHDYGKVLIPREILNKNGSLSPREKEIMDLHPIFSYELLKHKGIKPDILNLIKYHHQNLKGTGYPAIENDFKYDIASQILTASDKYTALTEKRAYHEPLPKEKALEIIREDVNSENLSQEVFDALKKSV